MSTLQGSDRDQGLWLEIGKDAIKSLFNLHRPDGSPDIFVFTMPRSGSTWLMELIGDQPTFKTCSEPLNLRLPLVRKHLGICSWHQLHDPALEPVLEQYFRAFISGRLHFLDPIPWRNEVYRLYTRRIVFKVVHGGEERINWFRDTFRAKIVLLLRHPIAVSISREVLPRLDAYVESEYSLRFTVPQLALARKIIAEGSDLERGVLSWCFENAVPLADRSQDWAVVTYEQLVLEPRPVIDHLIDKLDLDSPERMIAGLTRASNVKRKSNATTRKLLEQPNPSSRERLVDKWRKTVSSDEEVRAMAILESFGIDAYRSGDVLPHERFWLAEEVQ